MADMSLPPPPAVVSLTQGYSAHPILPADVPEIAEFLCASKLSLAVNRLLYKDWPAFNVQKAHYTAALRGRDPNNNGWKVVEDESGVAVGHLFLTKSDPSSRTDGSGDAGGTESEDKVAASAGEVPGGMVPEVYRMVMETVKNVDEQSALANVEHLRLTHIWVTPSHRGRGIGTSLITLCQNKARETSGDGRPLFVSCEPQLEPFLSGKCGFQHTGHADMDLASHAPVYSGFGPFRLFGLRWDAPKDVN
ncbi:uncharacterized protein B0I36DRAFT_381631 [Microdochium trichocladiopsis]|uniref:N-acetyltransferase domain-containing protein n=1 Tax=Microdochium trichocladiopsis TaxID=1682393 RepID=A0A9P9BSN3_9PEZI|nr:uncharacterized protein B0I36DRAFT_381631 [Microdochium trichocladiopsis]KAH7034769.1 hypothetical protein B0I36DRAFT_381631 [Microdochium trichocladiopsis]